MKHRISLYWHGMGVLSYKGYFHLWAGDLDIEFISVRVWKETGIFEDGPNVVIMFAGNVRYQWRWPR